MLLSMILQSARGVGVQPCKGDISCGNSHTASLVPKTHIQTNSAGKQEGAGCGDHQKTKLCSLASFPSGRQSSFARSEPFPSPLFGNGRSAPVPLQSPLHLPPTQAPHPGTHGQEKRQYLHYTNSGFSVRTK